MNDKLLWYTARGAGAVTLVLLSAVVLLGLAARLRLEGRLWPRFLNPALHRDLSVCALVMLVLHVVTAVVDPFTHLGFVAAVVPFSSYYRTFWLGLGTVSLELLFAVGITSLLRHVIGRRAWRGVHWLAYAAWPFAVAHSLGTGTDALSVWLTPITLVCIVAVVAGAIARVVLAPRDPLATERPGAAQRASVQGVHR